MRSTPEKNNIKLTLLVIPIYDIMNTITSSVTAEDRGGTIRTAAVAEEACLGQDRPLETNSLQAGVKSEFSFSQTSCRLLPIIWREKRLIHT